MAIKSYLLPYLLSSCLVLGALPSCKNRSGQLLSTKAASSAELTNPGRAAVVLPGGQTIADVAAKVTPSVVNVFSEKKASRTPPDLSPFFSDPFFRFFFDHPGRSFREAPERREQSLGSGVIVSSNGVIVTNNHVVAQADKIRVALKDGRELEAKLVGSDPKSDVAVLRVDAKDLTPLPIADSSKIRIGDLVLAIGNPFGIGQTVTMGIISAVGRANMGITDYEDFIQTDAAINPGNSGGALVTMDGQLVGINTAIVSRSGGYQGIGFAIPSNMVQEVENSILKHGKVVRGWLGVTIQDLSDDLADSLDVKARSGVLVSDVTPGSPAAKAGLVRGDVITALDGVKLQNSAHLRNLIARAGKGTRVHVDFLRSGHERSVEVTLSELPTDAADDASAYQPSEAADTGLLAGVTVRELDAQARQRLDVPARISGVVVTSIGPDSRAARKGLREGDIIVEINGAAIESPDDFQKTARKLDRRALLLVFRDGVTHFVSVKE